MSKFPNPAFISAEPPRDSIYNGARIQAFYTTSREQMTEEDNQRRQSQLEERLDELHRTRQKDKSIGPQVYIGYPDEDGNIYTQIVIDGPVTEEELWAMENAAIVTLVGPEGDIELTTIIDPLSTEP